MANYEFVAPGFDGSTDETDSLVLWVNSFLPPGDLATQLKADGVMAVDSDISELPDSFDAEYRYPAEREKLIEDVKKRIDEINKNRPQNT